MSVHTVPSARCAILSEIVRSVAIWLKRITETETVVLVYLQIVDDPTNIKGLVLLLAPLHGVSMPQ